MDEETRAAVERLREWYEWQSPQMQAHLMDTDCLGQLGTVLDALDRLAPMAPLLEIIERLMSLGLEQETLWSLQVGRRADQGPRDTREYFAGYSIYMGGSGKSLSDTPLNAIAALSAALAETDGTEAERC